MIWRIWRKKSLFTFWIQVHFNFTNFLDTNASQKLQLANNLMQFREFMIKTFEFRSFWQEMLKNLLRK